MKQEERDRESLIDMVEAATKILDFTQDGSRDTKTESAVIREIAVIGEAASRVSEKLKDSHPHVPWTKIRGMRNLLIHQYEGIDMRRVWEVVERDIPVLKAQVAKILSTD